MRNLILAILMLIPCGDAFGNSKTENEPGNKKKGALYVVATAHLDTQWRWTIKKTIDEYIPATFRDNFRLFEMFPDYTFSFEGAFRYMLFKEYYPDEYERLKPYVAQGRWRVAGSWVDAVDVNLPSPESLIRHVLYGNGFFRREFGKTSRDVFLPDCFGFGYTLPSIASHCGLESFSTQKLTWGSSVGIPFDIGIWEGVDGSSLIAALNPGAYVSEVRNDLSRDTVWMNAIERQGQMSGLYAGYKYFGTGDIGGAPDSASVAWVQTSTTSDGPIKVSNIGSDDLAEMITSEEMENLPRYKGELLMTRHGVGCYTSQAAMKRWNRKNELLADAAERASVIADLLGGISYPRELIKEAWIRFLWHQFHDDLTGTSIPEAYEFSWNDEILSLNQFASTLKSAVGATSPALDTRVVGLPLLILNPLSIEREDIVEATVVFEDGPPPAIRVYGPDGAEVPSQIASRNGDSLKILFLANVPSVGYAVYDVRPSRQPCSINTGLSITAASLENARYRVQLNDSGDVTSIIDKAEDRELLSGPVRLQLLHDEPERWAAWEIDYDDIATKPRGIVGDSVDVLMIENGPARVSLEVARASGNSGFRRKISLSAGKAANRVEFACAVDWFERETLLKAAFSLTTANNNVTYDLGLGSIERGLNRPELYEVPGHQWADMTSKTGDYGVAILNDCKYGWDHPDTETLRLTLIHTPGVPDDWSWIKDQRSQDNGHHEFTYAIQGHRGDWRDGAVPWEAARLNQPLLAFQTVKHDGPLGRTFSLLGVRTLDSSGESKATMEQLSVAVKAVKLAENSDEIVVRLQELFGTSIDHAQVRFARPIMAAREVNGAEEHMGAASIKDGVLNTSFTPFQTRAFALTLGGNEDKPLAPPSSQPLQLPFNLDGISLDSDRLDGDFDGAGNTLSGDLLPDTLTYQGVPFVLGPKTHGAPNAVSCLGQTLTLPAGRYNRLDLLITAVSGPAEGRFSVNGQDYRIWVQDHTASLGQWNNRMVNGALVEDADLIAPAYINRAEVAWAGTHRHNADGNNEAYQFTYLYMVHLDLRPDASFVTLPDNQHVKLLAATLVKANSDDVHATQPLYDVANNTIARVLAERTSFIDRIQVRLSSPIPGATIHYTLDGSNPTGKSPRY
ncbi:MAG: glycoside hydrolase family 38 C-terminal domain-containing protein, partial [Candidatus Zixiibacteriota bacterium]